jgi:hypothetical protein
MTMIFMSMSSKSSIRWGVGRLADGMDNAPSRRIEAIRRKLRSPSSKVQVLLT